MPFCGRQWLFADILEHCSTSSSSSTASTRGVIVTGAAGTGKTSIALALVERSCFGGRGSPANGSVTPRRSEDALQRLSSLVVAYHFCQPDNAPTCSVPEFVHNLAAQLSQAPLLKPYLDQLTADANLRNALSMESCLRDPDKAFREGVLAPLSQLDRAVARALGGHVAVVVVDGLGEESGRGGEPIADFIARHMSLVPLFIRFVVTARSEAAAQLRELPFQPISLDKSDLDERIRKDVGDYISLRMSRNPRLVINVTPTTSGRMSPRGSEAMSPEQQFTQHLKTISRGNMLYTRLVLDLVEQGSLALKTSSFHALPQSLVEAFRLMVGLRFPSHSTVSRVFDIVSVCAAAEEPLTVADLFACVQNATEDRTSLAWADFAARLNALSGFVVRRADDSLMLFHPAFREWLLVGDGVQKRICDPVSGHASIAAHISSTLGSGEIGNLPDRILALAHHVLRGGLSFNWMQVPEQHLSMALTSPRNVLSADVASSRSLLEHGASARHRCDALNGAPAITLFAARGHEDMVELLLEFGADVNEPDRSGVTPLMMASERGRTDVVRRLLTAGAKCSSVDASERCALVHAAAAGHLKTAELLAAAEWNADGAKCSFTMKEALQQACVAAAANAYSEVVEFLLDMPEVDVNGTETLRGSTALTEAATAGHRDCCLALLRRGADVAMADIKGATALHMASRHGHWSVVDLLLSHSADADQRDASGRTALMLAAAEGHTGIIDLLLKAGSSIAATDSSGLTCLSWACLRGHVDAASRLLSSGCAVDHADKHGRTPLDLASHGGSADVVQLLLDRGAALEHVDLSGMRPLDRAIACRNVAVVQCFLRKGARLGPTTWAMANGKPEILLQLLNKLLEDGNVLFKRELLSEASHRYEYALRRLPSASAYSNAPDGLNEAFDRLRVHLLLNLSRCKRKSGQTDKAVSLADQVLETQPHCFEAFYSKAKAHREAGDLRAAMAALAEAVRVAPQSREANRVLIRIRQDIAAAEVDAAKQRCADGADSSSGVDSLGSVSSAREEDVETSLVI